MAIPAAEPAIDPEPAIPGAPAVDVDRSGSVPRRPRGGRPGRRAGAAIALVAGVSILGAGVIRTAAGLGPTASGPLAAIGASPSATAGASAIVGPSTMPSEPSPAAGSGGPGASPSAGPSTEPVPSGPPLVPVEARLQASLDRIRAKLGIPGVSATVVLPDGTAWSGASGLAVVATKTPVTPATAFAFASVSKTFTSALILQLVHEGRLRLADPAAGLLPPLRLAIDRRITVGMLLNHTSGLADYFLNPKIDGPLQKAPTAIWTTDRTLGYVGKRTSAPGAAWHYSNTNYLLLGLIAERLTGQPLDVAIRTRLLEPAGLGATWYQSAERGRAALAHGYRQPGTKVNVKPIDLDDGSGVAPFRSVVTAAAGAGSMAGTSADLATWARALYTGRVLGPDGTALLLSGFRKTANYLPGVAYGYGVQAVSIDGHPSLGHSGRLLGFRSAVRHFPLDGLTIAVLTNQSRADPALIVRALLTAALPPPPAPVAPPPGPSGSPASSGSPGASGSIAPGVTSPPPG